MLFAGFICFVVLFVTITAEALTPFLTQADDLDEEEFDEED